VGRDDRAGLAVRAFAGAEHDRAVVSPEARRLLSRFDERVRLYELAIVTPRR
jgi:hypothetical protein